MDRTRTNTIGPASSWWQEKMIVSSALFGFFPTIPRVAGIGSAVGWRFNGFPCLPCGRRLGREAMRQVKKRGCRVFSAHIQEKNVRFFQKLGWAAVGPMETYCGHPHQPMLADLSRIPADFEENCSNAEPQMESRRPLDHAIPKGALHARSIERRHHTDSKLSRRLA